MEINLKNKKALVCDSTSSIGKAIAIELAISGASVTLLARNENKLKKGLESLPSSDNQTHTYAVADFQNPKEILQIAKKLSKEQTYHILINNTGGPKGGALLNASNDEFIEAFTMHILANQTLAQHIVPGMKKLGYGRIINIISTSVKQPIDGLGVSNTIRGAMGSWSKTMANELGQYGITVNNVLPGFTATQRLDEIIKTRAKRDAITEEKVAEQMKSQVPAKRFASPNEVAYAAVFLSSPVAQYINGVNLPVDGGRTKSL